MKDRRPINEDDVYLTELLLARSYGNLKRSVTRASSDTLGSLGDTIGGTVRRHPYATAGAAVGIGVLLAGLFTVMSRGNASRGRETGRRGDAGPDVIAMILPILTPYITAYLEKYLGTMFSRGRTRSG